MVMHNSYQPEKWYAVYTRSKCESVVTGELSKICETYLPMQWVKRKWSDRIKKLRVPLIPSYMFIKIAEGKKIDILKNRNVLTIINNKGNMLSVPDREMNLIRRIEKSKIHFDFIQNGYEYRLGEKIEFTSGPLFGLEGYLDGFLNNSSVAIIVPSLGCGFKSKLKHISPHYSDLMLEPV